MSPGGKLRQERLQRSPSQTTREATTCAPPDGPVTIAADALLALAAWLDQRRTTEATHAQRRIRSASPPAPAPPPNPLTAIWAQLPPDRRRRLQRLLAELLARPVDHRRGPAAGGAS